MDCSPSSFYRMIGDLQFSLPPLIIIEYQEKIHKNPNYIKKRNPYDLIPLLKSLLSLIKYCNISRFSGGGWL